MRGVSRLAPTIRRLGWPAALLLVAVTGCRPASPLGQAGVGFTPPPPWRSVAPTTWPVPGRPMAAWAGPDGASLVVYRALPVPGGDATELATALANRLTNLPGLRVVERRVETWSGAEAARVEAVAPGTGGALAPSGTGVPLVRDVAALVPTRRVVIGFARPDDTFYIAWHAPESSNPWLQEQVRATLKGLKLGSQPARHTY
jgi:hypothetical protein